MVQVRMRDGFTAKGRVNQFYWGFLGKSGDILAYRIVDAAT
jgi:hypothetical protein